MPESDFRTDIEVIKADLRNMADQLKRFISHLESEQRVTGEISKRVDQISMEMQFLQSQIKEKQSSGKWRVELVVSLMALLITTATLLITIFK